MLELFVRFFLVFLLGGPTVAVASSSSDPESAIRRMIQANADKDLETLSQLMAHDSDIISYAVAGRKYIGWAELEQGMRDEFVNAKKLEIPIKLLTVWTKGDLAWYAMELDYIRYIQEGADLKRTVLPMRETGVLERRQGRWQLLSWHESFRSADLGGTESAPLTDSPQTHASKPQSSGQLDVSGTWEILEVEDDKRYQATLDRNGNGPYNQHGGRFTTTTITERLWEGTWHQTGNDREGGFELQLSEDGTEAKGIWWYTRVGKQNGIPPREHGGTYHWKKPRPASDKAR